MVRKVIPDLPYQGEIVVIGSRDENEEGLGGTEAGAQSTNVQVSAPSKRLTTTDSNSFGSKLRRFTPCRAPGFESSGSQ